LAERLAYDKKNLIVRYGKSVRRWGNLLGWESDGLIKTRAAFVVNFSPDGFRIPDLLLPMMRWGTGGSTRGAKAAYRNCGNRGVVRSPINLQPY